MSNLTDNSVLTPIQETPRHLADDDCTFVRNFALEEQPNIIRQVYEKTGFNWDKTAIRQRIVFVLCSEDVQVDGLILLLSELARLYYNWDNDLEDRELLDKLVGKRKNPNGPVWHGAKKTPEVPMLKQKLEEFSQFLFAGMEVYSKREEIIDRIVNIVMIIRDDFNDVISLIGDPCATVEDQVSHFCRMSLVMPDSSVCGIMANILYDSHFSCTAWDKDEDSYGLLKIPCCFPQYDIGEYKTAADSRYCGVASQMKRLKDLLEGPYKKLYTKLQRIPEDELGASTAAILWCETMNPDATAADKSRRAHAAQKLYWPVYGKYHRDKYWHLWKQKQP